MDPENAIQCLRTIVRQNGTVLVTPQEKAPYLIDWRKKIKGNALAVVEPQHVKDIQKIVRFCEKEGIRITPQGGNTGKCGGCIPDRQGKKNIVLSLRQLNRIRDYDPLNQTMTVDSGCRLAQIQSFCQEDNLYFPLSLTSEQECTIGGNLATNAGGCCVFQNGMTRNQVLGIEVVLSKGQIYSDLRKIVKNNDSYDIKNLFVGSEGTLGIITAAVLKLKYKPHGYITALIGAKSLPFLLDTVHHIKKKFSHHIESIEVFSRNCQKLVATHHKLHPPFEADWFILIDIGTHHPNEKKIYQKELHHTLEQFLTNKKITAYKDTICEQERNHFWALRRMIPWAEQTHKTIIKNDIALPLSEWVPFYNKIQKLKKQDKKLSFLIFGHVGDGSLHVNLYPCCSNTEKLMKLFHEIIKTHNGSIAAEHGVGQTKRKWIEPFQGTEQKKIMKKMKNLLDPQNIFNPGKKISPHS